MFVWGGVLTFVAYPTHSSDIPILFQVFRDLSTDL